MQVSTFLSLSAHGGRERKTDPERDQKQKVVKEKWCEDHKKEMLGKF